MLVATAVAFGMLRGGAHPTTTPHDAALLLSLPPGHIATYAGGLQDPHGLGTHLAISAVNVTLAGSGELLIVDSASRVVWLVNTAHRAVTRWGRTVEAGLTAIVAGNTGEIYAGDGVHATDISMQPAGVAVDSTGNLYIADQRNDLIIKVAATSGIVTTVAGNIHARQTGDGGPALQAGLANPIGITVDPAGNLYIADGGANRVRKVVAATGIISTVAGIGKVAFAGLGGYSGDGGLATRAALSMPTSVVLDRAGNLYIADSGNNRVRRVAAGSGIITTVAGNGHEGFSGDGGPATKARLNQPVALAVDSTGNLFIADSRNARVRKVAAGTGIITTVAGNGQNGYRGDGGPAAHAWLGGPSALAVDRAGNLYIDDSGNRIRMVAAGTGTITTVAGTGHDGYGGDGGPASKAQFTYISSLAVDGAGNLYIADTFNFRVREVVARTGIVSTVAGHGVKNINPPVDGALNLPFMGTFSGDTGLATQAGLNAPSGLAIDGQGNLYIADTLNNRVRVVRGVTHRVAR